MKGQLTLGHNNPPENLSAQQTDASYKACAQRLRLYISLWHGQLAFRRNKGESESILSGWSAILIREM